VSRWVRVAIIVAVVGVVVVAAYFGVRYLEGRRAQEAISAYNTALSVAVYELDPELLSDVAGEREKGRVANYITLLWGEGTKMEATLVEMKISEIESSDPTVTALSHETWRYQRRDAESGETVGDEITEMQTLHYTLLRGEDGILRVHLSQIMEGQTE